MLVFVVFSVIGKDTLHCFLVDMNCRIASLLHGKHFLNLYFMDCNNINCKEDAFNIFLNCGLVKPFETLEFKTSNDCNCFVLIFSACF